MASNLSSYVQDALFCGDIGLNNTRIDCCYKDPINDCDFVFDPSDNWLQVGCPSGNCAVDCQNATYIYSTSFFANNPSVDTEAIPPWTTCLNVPNMAGYLQQGVLAPNISSHVETYIPRNISTENLQNITKAVSVCLSTTCSLARNPSICSEACSPVKLLLNQTTPSYEGLNECMFQLCTNGYDAVPFANADIVGIGVFSSYIMQCGIILLLWLAFLLFAILQRSTAFSGERAWLAKQQDMLVTGLIEFHKAQSFFSITIQIASLSYGLFTMDLLIVFLVIPLATNGIVPVVFGHLLVLRYGRSSVYITVLTGVSWVLSSIVVWSLYMHLIPIKNDSILDVYENVFYQLSSNSDCGGFSALAACPENLQEGFAEVKSSFHHIHGLTPLLWAWGTLIFFVLVAYQIFRSFLRKGNKRAGYMKKIRDQNLNAINTSFLRAAFSTEGIFWILTITFVAAMGIQLALLYVEASIKMISNGWSFGQIVAITIWVPPLVEYLYLQMKGVEKAAEHRLAKTIKVSRVPSASHGGHQRLKDDDLESSTDTLPLTDAPTRRRRDRSRSESGASQPPRRQTKRWSGRSNSTVDEGETDELSNDIRPNDDEREYRDTDAA